jgi:hypothetical protein
MINKKCSATLEVLNRPLMGLRGFSRIERSEVASASSFGILFARVQPELTGF